MWLMTQSGARELVSHDGSLMLLPNMGESKRMTQLVNDDNQKEEAQLDEPGGCYCQGYNKPHKRVNMNFTEQLNGSIQIVSPVSGQ